MRRDLPPEAFTKETLQEAFNWLQDQEEPVRATVHTPERLVSLYRKAQRLSDVDAPVSSKKFVDDLKNLATSLDQFSSSPQGSANTPTSTHPVPPQMGGGVMTTNKTSEKTSSLSEPIVKGAPPKTSFDTSFDPLTQKRIHKVRSRFNLSSDQEAIRLLISLGYEKFSNF